MFCSIYTLIVAPFIKRKEHVDCDSDDEVYLRKRSTVKLCAAKCRETKGCRFFIYGFGLGGVNPSDMKCFWEKTETHSETHCDGETWTTHIGIGDLSRRVSYHFYELLGIIYIH